MNDSLMQGAWPEAAPAPQENTDDASLFLLQHAGQRAGLRLLDAVRRRAKPFGQFVLGRAQPRNIGQ